MTRALDARCRAIPSRRLSACQLLHRRPTHLHPRTGNWQAAGVRPLQVYRSVRDAIRERIERELLPPSPGDTKTL